MTKKINVGRAFFENSLYPDKGVLYTTGLDGWYSLEDTIKIRDFLNEIIGEDQPQPAAPPSDLEARVKALEEKVVGVVELATDPFDSVTIERGDVGSIWLHDRGTKIHLSNSLPKFQTLLQEGSGFLVNLAGGTVSVSTPDPAGRRVMEVNGHKSVVSGTLWASWVKDFGGVEEKEETFDAVLPLWHGAEKDSIFFNTGIYTHAEMDQVASAVENGNTWESPDMGLRVNSGVIYFRDARYSGDSQAVAKKIRELTMPQVEPSLESFKDENGQIFSVFGGRIDVLDPGDDDFIDLTKCQAVQLHQDLDDNRHHLAGHHTHFIPTGDLVVILCGSSSRKVDYRLFMSALEAAIRQLDRA